MQGFEHLDAGWVAVLRWLNAGGVDYVLVGGVAEAIRGRADAIGPVAIVPAPYRRNYDCLERTLAAGRARLRVEPPAPGQPDAVTVKLTAEKLGRGQRWTLRCGEHDLDIEAVHAPEDGDGEPGSTFQELLYEATRFQIAVGVSVEVASPEDIERYAHIARTGRNPTVRITRAVAVAQESA
jgi:hypothetical protein